MTRPPKSHSSPETSLDNAEVRRRTVRACQRCRLKKCKCDGTTPCTRCQSDDAICAYGIQRKSDKTTVIRSGYVQLLERQHAQLTAGLHELYRRTQNGGTWTGLQLQAVNHQPLTHKILEGLGVLQIDEWEGTESGPDIWQDLEGQGQDHSGWMHSKTASPSTQAAFSPPSPTQTAFPQSIIMVKRRAKILNNLAPITKPTIVPPLPMTFAHVKLESDYFTSADQAPARLDTLSSSESVYMGLDIGGGSMMDWSSGMDEWYSNLDGQKQAASLC
ncbi:hypothetical protein BDR22DRAFT_871566 [Usnea florida]